MVTLDNAFTQLGCSHLYWSSVDKFIRYNNSKIRQTLLELGGKELTIPELFDDMDDIIDFNSLTFREAVFR